MLDLKIEEPYQSKEYTMNTKRRETRYFFSSDHLVEIVHIVRTILGTELLHSHPVTETIYFTLGPEANYAFPKGLRVRARRYITELSNKVIIGNQSLFLEIKEETQGGVNQKRRVETTGTGMVTKLRDGFDQLPKLITYAATQSERLHWKINSSSRLTIDADIRLFGFAASKPLEAVRICDYGEGKLEFKLDNTDSDLIEELIVKATRCSSQDYTYLERKTRQCMTHWLNTAQR